jgi:hypothetical protein
MANTIKEVYVTRYTVAGSQPNDAKDRFVIYFSDGRPPCIAIHLGSNVFRIANGKTFRLKPKR